MVFDKSPKMCVKPGSVCGDLQKLQPPVTNNSQPPKSSLRRLSPSRNIILPSSALAPHRYLITHVHDPKATIQRKPSISAL